MKKAFDLYYDFDYDLGVRDMEDIRRYLQTIPECNGKVGAVGYCLGGKLCYLMCCRTDIDCAVAYYGTYIEHRISEVKNLHRPFVLHMAMKDRWVQAEVNDLLERRLSPNPLVTIHKYPDADHAFARHGGKTYSKPEADRALALSVDFFKRHLAAGSVIGGDLFRDRMGELGVLPSPRRGFEPIEGPIPPHPTPLPNGEREPIARAVRLRFMLQG